MTTVRFAPSPTGLLHVGNARVALVNWLFARRAGGRFILRFDDTDPDRSHERFVTAIRDDLSWLGLGWNDEVRQSERVGLYAAAFDRLAAAGRVYPCYETAAELERHRRRQLAVGRPPIYDRAALALDAAAQTRLEAEGRRPHWRFRLEHAEIAWHDGVRGPVRFDGANIGDPIVRREDGTFLYLLPSAVDDIAMGITDVIRGEDHVVNTAVQMQMTAALGAAPPSFAHLPLMTDIKGQGLSKRLGSFSLESLRADGIEAMAINTALAEVGTAEASEPAQDLAELVTRFDLGAYGRATPKFDPDRLRRLNSRLLHAMPFETAGPRLRGLGLDRADSSFWLAVRANLERIDEARAWHAICFDTLTPAGADTAFLDEARAHLPPEPWNDATWRTWTGAVRAATGRKGKDLFQPLRLALTGLDHGPEMAALLPLIGRERAIFRLGG